METAIEILEKMEKILDDLVKNAEALKDISMEGFSEQAVMPLQQKQELLVERLKALESVFSEADKDGQEEILAKVGDRITRKLRYFQHLNAVFVENISEGNILEDYMKSNIADVGLPKRKKADE